jgi:hypothetical protein
LLAEAGERQGVGSTDGEQEEAKDCQEEGDAVMMVSASLSVESCG